MLGLIWGNKLAQESANMIWQVNQKALLGLILFTTSE
jgi:hypothetical protein